MKDMGHVEFLEDNLATLAHPDNGENAMVQATAGGLLAIGHHLERIADSLTGQDTVKEFARFLARHVHRTGGVSEEEAHALYEDFYGPFEKTDSDESDG